MAIVRLHIKEAMDFAGCKDRRTFMRFCDENNIPIYRGVKQFILQLDLELVLDKSLLSFLQQSYPDSWDRIYKAYKTNDVVLLAQLKQEQKQRISFTETIKSATPVPSDIGEQGLSFLKSIS